MSESIKCVHCGATAYAELHLLCPQCYQETILRPAALEVFEAERAAFELRAKHLKLLLPLNKIEIGLGLRPAPYPENTERSSVRKVTTTPKTKPKATQSINSDDLEDM